MAPKPKKIVKNGTDPTVPAKRGNASRTGAKTGALTELPILQYGPTNNFLDFKRELVTHVQRNYGDLYLAITTLTYPTYDFELGDEFEDIDEELKAVLKRKEAELILARKDKLRQNKIVLYALIWGQMSTTSCHKVQEDALFEAAETMMDPIALWEIVEKTHSTAVSGIAECDKQVARATFGLCRQRPNGESVAEFKRRFDDAVLALQAAGLPEMDAQSQATEFTYRLDPHKYGQYWAMLENNAVNGNGKHPTTLADAFNRASRFVIYNDGSRKTANSESVYTIRVDDLAKKGDAKGKGKGKEKDKKKDNKSKKVNVHSTVEDAKDGAADGTTNSGSKSRFASATCNLCGELGHYAGKCPSMEEAKRWLKTQKERANMVMIDEDDEPSVNVTYINVRALTTGGNSTLSPTDVLLDNQATAGVFHNKAMLRNLRKSTRNAVITGVSGQALSTSWIGEVPYLGEVWYHPKATANILSLGRIEEVMKVTYEKQTGFTVNVKKDLAIRFRKRSPGKPGAGLFVADLSKLIKLEQVHATISTVDENLSHFSKSDQSGAKKALEFKQRMGFPSTNDCVTLSQQGVLTNLPVTRQDIRRADAIFGPHPAALKGKTVERKPKKVTFEFVPKPEVKQLTLHCDILFIAGQPMFLSVSTPLHLTIISKLKSRSKPDVKAALLEQLSRYTSERFDVRAVVSDGEGAVEQLRPELGRLGILVDKSGTGQHVPVAERMNRTIKERVRSILHSLPYRLPNSLKYWAAFFAVNRINLQPTSARGDALCPREAFTGRKADYERDVRFSFGEYVHVHQVSLGMKKGDVSIPRTMEAIALLPAGNARGSGIFWLFETKSTVVRDRWTSLPMPQHAIGVMNTMADREKAGSDAGVLPESLLGAVEDLDRDPGVPAGPPPVVHDQTVDLPPRLHPEERVPSMQDLTGAAGLESTVYNPDHLVEDDYAPSWQEPASTEEVPASVVPLVDEGVAPSDTGQRRSLRNPKPVQDESYEFYHISVKEGLKRFKDKAVECIQQELQQMLTKGVWKPVHLKDVPRDQKIIYSSMFLKEKFDSTGKFDKLKARLAAGGDMQDKEMYGSVSSPTVQTVHVFAELALAAWKQKTITTLDIGGAYLNASMVEDVYMRLDKTLSSIMVKLAPSYGTFLSSDGRLVVKLLKALYGCIESALLWYNHINNTLTSEGFKANPCDQCVFHKGSGKDKITVCVYVDDLLIVSNGQKSADLVVAYLEKAYKEIKCVRGKVHSYLGMTINMNERGCVSITMDGYVSDMLTEYGVAPRSRSATPATVDLFMHEGSPEPVSGDQKEMFRSRVAKILYLAKRVRPDLLLLCSILASRVNAPSIQDWNELERALRYINSTKDLGVRLEIGRELTVDAYVDSSYGVHPDGKSHTGVSMSLGRGCIYGHSSKQRIVTRSSTEAELVALSDSASVALGMREYLLAQDLDPGPVKIYQDNESTIKLIRDGRSSNSRMKHVAIRYFFVRDRIASSEVQIVQVPTEDMLADGMTKPLQGSLFQHLRALVLNEY